MQLHDKDLEMLVLYEFVHSERCRKVLSRRLNVNHFHVKAVREGFERVLYYLQTKGEPPTWDLLLSDPTIDESRRAMLRRYRPAKSSRLQSPQQATEALETLAKFSSMRKMGALSDMLNEALSGQVIDTAQVLEKASRLLADARQLGNKPTVIYHSGVGNNTSALLKKVLSQDAPALLPTGFPEFDEKTGGLPQTGLVTLGAYTSSLKSAVSLQLGINMYLINQVNVCKVSLEMSDEQEHSRLWSNLSGVPLSRFKRSKLTSREKKVITDAYKKFVQHGKDNDCRFSVFAPNASLTIQEVLSQLYHFGYRVIIIDYATLLKTSTEHQWRDLSDIARECKIFGTANNCLVVLLVQLNKDEDIRYSGGIQEHCLVAGQFVNINGRAVQVSDRLMRQVQVGSDVIDTATGPRTIRQVYQFGEKETRKFRTSAGYTVEVSATTPVLVLDPDFSYRWVKARDLRPGQHLVATRKQSWPMEEPNFEFSYEGETRKYTHLPRRMSPELGFVLGAIASEGYTGDREFNICNQDKAYIDEFVRCYRKVFKDSPKVGWNEHTRAYYAGVAGDEIAAFLKYLGSGGNSRSRRVPWAVMQATMESARQYLRAYFEGDGSVGIGISCLSYSHKLIGDTQKLLLKFGIVSRRYRHNDGKHHLPSRTSHRQGRNYTLYIGGTSARDFATRIGFFASRKQGACRDKMRDGWRTSNSEIIPYLSELLASRKKGRNSYVLPDGSSERVEISSHLGGSLVPAARPPENLRRFQQAVAENFPQWGRTLEQSLAHDFFFDKVVSIKEGSAPVFDFTVDNTGEHVLGEGNFVANGLVIHNSDNIWKWTVTDADRDAGGFTIKQTKGRDQPLFSFPVNVNFDTLRIEGAGTGQVLSEESDDDDDLSGHSLE